MDLFSARCIVYNIEVPDVHCNLIKYLFTNIDKCHITMLPILFIFKNIRPFFLTLYVEKYSKMSSSLSKIFETGMNVFKSKLDHKKCYEISTMYKYSKKNR